VATFRDIQRQLHREFFPGFVHSGSRANQHRTPSRRNASRVIEGKANHLYDLVNGVSILNATAFVHLAAIEKNCGHDWRQFFFLSLLVDCY